MNTGAIQTSQGGKAPTAAAPAKPVKPVKPAKKSKQPVLDNDLPFARVIGCKGPQAYLQNGQYFDVKGSLTDPLG